MYPYLRAEHLYLLFKKISDTICPNSEIVIGDSLLLKAVIWKAAYKQFHLLLSFFADFLIINIKAVRETHRFSEPDCGFYCVSVYFLFSLRLMELAF